MSDTSHPSIRPRTNGELREEATGRMIDTAIRLIAERGAARLTLVDVGKAAGYSHSLPNYYFKSKLGLLLAVYRFISETASERARAWIRARHPTPVEPGMDSLEAIVRSYLGLAAGDPTPSRVMNVLWSEAATSMPELIDTVQPSSRSYLAHYEAQVRAGIARGEIDPAVDPASVAVLVLALLRGVASQELLEPTRVDLAHIADVAVALLRKGLAPPAAARSTGMAALPLLDEAPPASSP